MPKLVERCRRAAESLKGKWDGARANRRMARDPQDPRVRYPAYKSLDAWLDLERLRSLDGFLREAILEHARSGPTAMFDAGTTTMRAFGKRREGGRVINLSVKEGADYFDLDKPEAWRPAPHAGRFAPLMDFLATLPFRATSRMLILYDERGRGITPHRDHSFPQLLHEFVWLRTNFDKSLYFLDREGKRRVDVSGHSAWFDTVNQFHAGDEHDGLTFSIRVDGVFDDAFRAQMPTPSTNLASTPSLWASLERN